ncbi:MAG: hypothetical protein K5637_04750 [Lachnospiraceae bacterium]|nr:hypothetical protein [Lachnospiraceae bacterium]
MKADSLLKLSAAVLAAGAAVGLIIYLKDSEERDHEPEREMPVEEEIPEEDGQEEPDRQAYAKRGYVRIHSAYTEDAGTGNCS